MQILQLAIVVGAVVIAVVIMVAGREGRRSAAAVVGPVVGVLAAFVVLVRTTDIVPDRIDDGIGDLGILALVSIGATGLIALSLYLSRR